ncbi:hypothetical protein FUT69_08965 [Xylella taiwanensis]|uniref:Uncharacterized protein n=1 Tax=Xylella taiwanensis TaxID=1444770 RepID=Z9JHD7_9GAMM|nr:hypothetical protein [Xylella taiwanensis]AXI82846.1 hypothetical protein AB672_02165 [Xylella taiwanensis]EWS77564.1 hypothetical protein AF72_10135 [Xylella taiwanensis]MCD8458259.1 hypothetical protein [Xylella taiwanensis]MCD8460396.1 hypothetical protein [Xylella taiwanensis]MCD8463545.1 hypothetical protein [Xylella taiwanensis]
MVSLLARVAIEHFGSGTTSNAVVLSSVRIICADDDQYRYKVTAGDRYSGVCMDGTDKSGTDHQSVLVGESGNAYVFA